MNAVDGIDTAEIDRINRNETRNKTTTKRKRKTKLNSSNNNNNNLIVESSCTLVAIHTILQMHNFAKCNIHNYKIMDGTFCRCCCVFANAIFLHTIRQKHE